jgi:hypothetical protein
MQTRCQNSQSTDKNFYQNLQYKSLQHLQDRRTDNLFNQQIPLYYSKIISVSDDSILPFHHVRPAAYQAKDKGSHPLPSLEDWSMAHSTAEHSWPAELTVEVQSMVSHQLLDQMLSVLAVGQTAHSIQQTKWTGCDAHLALRVWCTFPLEINKTLFHCHRYLQNLCK